MFQKKLCLQKALLSFFFLCSSLPCIASLAPTKHFELPPPVSYVENLYFLYPSHFIAFGDEVQPDKIMAPIPERPFSLVKILPGQKRISQKLMHTMNSPAHLFDGTTLILMESHGNYFFHFFHLLEHLVGVWAFYGYEHAPDIKRIIFAGATLQNHYSWQGPNQINQHVLSALFPQAEVLTWDRFVRQCGHDLACFERAVVSDRGITALYPECSKINKHLGAALPHIDPKNLQSFADSVHAYAQTKQEEHSAQLRITYVKRSPPRCLSERLDREFIAKISALPHVRLQVVDFARISFQEQINIVGNTDVLIGVHGNGLSHTLFLPSTACVIEIFPPNNHHLDYHVFADARGIDYFGILYKEREFIERTRAYSIGAFGNPSKAIVELDIDLILSAIRSRMTGITR
jgi:hypothetical protein